MPEKELYRKILKYLVNNGGINHEVDISNLFDNSYLKPDTMPDVYLHQRINKITGFLDSMVNNKHITYNNKKVESNARQLTYVLPISITASITSDGYKYFLDVRTSRRAFRVSIISIIISGLSFICAGVMVWIKVNEKQEQQKQHQQEKSPPPNTKA